MLNCRTTTMSIIYIFLKNKSMVLKDEKKKLQNLSYEYIKIKK